MGDPAKDIKIVNPDDPASPQRSTSAADIAWATIFRDPHSQSQASDVEMEPTLPSKKDTKVSSFPRVLSSQELNQRLNIERQDSDFKERPGRGAQNDSATVSGVKAVEMAKELLHSRTSKTKFTGAAVDEDSSSDAHTPSANLTVSGVTGVQIANELNFAMAHPTHGPVLDNMSPNNTINKEADNQLVNRLQ
eukprot:gene25064-30580_t